MNSFHLRYLHYTLTQFLKSLQKWQADELIKTLNSLADSEVTSTIPTVLPVSIFYFFISVVGVIFKELSNVSVKILVNAVCWCDCDLQFSYLWSLFCPCFCRLMTQGYKRPLEEQDLWSLNEDDQSQGVVAQLIRSWQHECAKIKRSVNQHPMQYILFGVICEFFNFCLDQNK